jgi:hypothetical protein
MCKSSCSYPIGVSLICRLCMRKSCCPRKQAKSYIFNPESFPHAVRITIAVPPPYLPHVDVSKFDTLFPTGPKPSFTVVQGGGLFSNGVTGKMMMRWQLAQTSAPIMVFGVWCFCDSFGSCLVRSIYNHVSDATARAECGKASKMLIAVAHVVVGAKDLVELE